MERVKLSATAINTDLIVLKRKDFEEHAAELFSVRTKPLINGNLRQDRQQVAETINIIFNEEITITGKEQKE